MHRVTIVVSLVRYSVASVVQSVTSLHTIHFPYGSAAAIIHYCYYYV